MKSYLVIVSPMLLGVFQAANSALEFVILLAAALTAIGVLWIKGVRPVMAFTSSVTEAIGHIKGIPSFQAEVLTRMEVLEGAFYGSDVTHHLPTRRRNDPPYDQASGR